MITAIVTGIEGTITSLAFVDEVLLAYARGRLAGFVQANGSRAEVLEQLILAGAMCGRPLDRAAIVRELEAWSDAGRVAMPLQALQEMIAAEGYARGELVAHVYDDAAAALRQWRADGVQLYACSSRSVAAQRLLLTHSRHGDLSRCFAGFFDARTVDLHDPGSFRRIAAAIGMAPASVLFLSDKVAELEAAGAAGLHRQRVDRERMPAAAGAVSTFAAIDLGAVRT